MKKKLKLPEDPLWVFYAVLAVMICGILLSGFGKGIFGNDFWWHVKAGEWIVTHRRVPTVDIFSWIGRETGLEWTAHEWLSEVIFYLIYRTFGERGIYLLSIALAVAFVALLMGGGRRDFCRNPIIAAAFFALVAQDAALVFYGRPHIFGFFLLFAELKLLYDFYGNPTRKRIFFLPLIACLWSNLHGGSANLSYILCGLFLTVSLVRLDVGRLHAERMDRRGLIRLGGVTAATAAAVLVNPIGWRVLVYPYMNLSNQLMMSTISEWGAPDAKNLGHVVLMFLPVALMAVGFLTTEKRIRLLDAAVMAAFLYLFFRSTRFIILWEIAAVFCAFPYMPQWKVTPPKNKLEEKVVAAGLAVALLWTGSNAWGIVRRSGEDKIISTVISEEMLDRVEQAAPRRIFNDYNVGEALIYRGIPVFFDARADLFGAEHLFEDGASLMLLSQHNTAEETAWMDVEATVDRYRFDSILIGQSRPLNGYLRSHPEAYTLLFDDSSWAYYRVNRYQ